MANTQTQTPTHQAGHVSAGILQLEIAGEAKRGSCGRVCATCPLRGPTCASEAAASGGQLLR